MLALEVFSWAFGNARATGVPNKMMIFTESPVHLGLSRCQRERRLTVHRLQGAFRSSVKLDTDAMLALEVFSWAFGNSGATEVPNKMMIFTENRPSISVFRAVDDNED